MKALEFILESIVDQISKTEGKIHRLDLAKMLYADSQFSVYTVEIHDDGKARRFKAIGVIGGSWNLTELK